MKKIPILLILATVALMSCEHLEKVNPAFYKHAKQKYSNAFTEFSVSIENVSPHKDFFCQRWIWQWTSFSG